MKYFKPSAAIFATLLGGSIVMAAPGNKADSNGDGILTKAEASSAASARFAKMDITGDGLINDADRDARAAQRFAKMDTDGDGTVSESEFSKARETRKAKREARRADRQAAGEERKAGERKGRGDKGASRGGGKGGGKGMLRQADSNNDQAVSLAEFMAHSDARFAKMDANGDDQVTAEERKASRRANRAERKQR